MNAPFDATDTTSDLELRRAALKAIRAAKTKGDGNNATVGVSNDLEAPSSFGTPVSPVLDNSEPKADQGRMIFLRPNKENGGWTVQFYGIAGLDYAAKNIPAELGGQTLREVLGYIGETYRGKLGGAWLLVAP